MLGNRQEDEESEEASDGLPTLKRARIDEDGLIAKAVLAYAVRINKDTDLPTTYDQAMSTTDAFKWR